MKMMILGMLLALPAFAAKYDVDSAHTTVGFTVKHLVVAKVKGKFDKFKGEFEFTPGKLETLKVKTEVQTTSINTNEKDRDKHLRSADFFDVQKFPVMRMASKSIKDIDGNKAKMESDLTIKSTTKTVVFDLEYNGAAKDPWGNNKVSFTASAKINRKDFGLNWSKLIEGGGLVVADEVLIELEIEGNEKK